VSVVAIKTHEGEPRIKAFATATAGLVVHRTWSPTLGYLRVRSYFTLTHAPTGMAIFRNFRSKQAALVAALSLGELGIDWLSINASDGITALPEGPRKAAIEIVRSLSGVQR
jgi:hypothetical protein